MNDKNLNMPSNATHLGIKRDTSSKFGVKQVLPDRIQTARKTVYTLMGAGLYGMNGINPMVSIHMIKCFVLPRLLYGLDVIKLTKTDIKKTFNILCTITKTNSTCSCPYINSSSTNSSWTNTNRS
jgi:hypothetical protein